MTPQDIMTAFTNPWELAAVYAASFGLFAPGTLMAARQRIPEPQTPPNSIR